MGLGLDAGVREQVLDYLLHLVRAVDDELDVPVGPLVERVPVPPRQELGEARDRPEGLLQVVARDVRELLQLLVRPRELAAPPLQFGGGRAVPGDLPLQAQVGLDEVGRALPDPVIEVIVCVLERLPRALKFGDVPGNREDTGDGALLVPVDGRVVPHGGDATVAVAELERIIGDRPVPEDRLVPRSRPPGIGEVVGELGADELVAGEAGRPHGRVVHIKDGTIGTDRHEWVEARLDQTPVVTVGAPRGLLGLLELGDVASGGEDAGHLALLVAVDRRVVHDGPDRAVAVADAELVIADGAGSERGLVPGLGAGGIGEVGREVGPDQLVTRDTGHLDRRLVHIGDGAIGADGHERIEARLDQTPVVVVGTLDGHLGQFLLGDVPRDGRRACDPSFPIADR